MKRYCKRFEFDNDFIEVSIRDCLMTRWRRRDTSYFFANYVLLYASQYNNGKHINKHDMSKLINRYLKMGEKDRFDRLIKLISTYFLCEINDRDIKLEPIRYKCRYDSSSMKKRNIGLSSIKQQCYDYIVVNAIKDMLMAKIGMYQCASIKGRGQIYGKKAIEKWIRKDTKNCKWIFKCDIRKCYPNINHDILKSLLRRDIKSDDVLYVAYTLIDTYDKGLCIGSYLSQFLANYYLSYVYHYINENMYRIRKCKNGNIKREKLVKHILFYMDDMILFSNNKSNLKKAKRELEKYLKEKLDLEIKDDYKFFKLDSIPIDMMGFKFTTKCTTIRRRVFRRANKLFNKYKRIRYISFHDSKRLCSYYGFIKHTNSYRYKNKMNVETTMENAKRRIRKA